MHTVTHAFEPFLGPWRGQPAWTRPRRVEHPLLDQVLYERRMVERELADKERIDVVAFGEVFEDSLDPAQ